MIELIMVWWHRSVLKHDVRESRVSVPMWDPGARGILYRCSCGKDYAR